MQPSPGLPESGSNASSSLHLELYGSNNSITTMIVTIITTETLLFDISQKSFFPPISLL